MFKEIETVKDLKVFLNNMDDNSPIFLGTWNGYSDTYTVADHVFKDKYESIENDFFGTRGKMDKRLFNADFEGKDVVYIGSIFHRNIDNDKIDFKDNPNEPIELINGEDGDHDLFWKSNNFEKIDDEYWKLSNDEEHWFVLYYPSSKSLIVDCQEKYHFEGECIGLEDFFDIMKACRIKRTWRIG